MNYDAMRVFQQCELDEVKALFVKQPKDSSIGGRKLCKRMMFPAATRSDRALLSTTVS